jgi:multiple sugar transport system permease protein
MGLGMEVADRQPLWSLRRRKSLQRPRVRFVMLAPTVALLVAMTIFPLCYAVYVSLHTWKLTFPFKPWIGIDNYKQLLTADPRFTNSLEKTAIIGGAALAIEFLLGFALAIFFWSTFRKARWLATIILIPMMISPVVVGFTGRMAFTDSYGFINQLIGFVAGRDVSINWLADPTLAPFVIIMADVWQWTPFVFLILLAGLMSVSQDQLEAAEVDGAPRWRVFRHIVLPSMRNVIIIVLILRGLELIKLFDVVQLTTRAGPGISTETTTVYLYNIAFKFFDLGYSSAAAFVLLIAVSVLVYLGLRLLTRERV